VTILSGVLWFGGKLVLNGDILSPGSFITYVALFSQIINPAKAFITSGLQCKSRYGYTR